MSGADDTIHVLHVDDEPSLTDMVATFLERKDDRITVQTATNAKEGRGMLADHDVDCVVSDYDMPGQDGIEFLETVRDVYPNLPFILFTGKGSEEVASEAVSAGVSDYLQKESGTDQYTVLANRIINLVTQYRAEIEVERFTRLRDESEEYRDRLLEIALDQDRSPEETIQDLLALGCERFGVENGHLVLIDQEQERHNVVSVVGSDIVQQGVSDLSNTYCRTTITSESHVEMHNAVEQGWEDDPAYETYGLGCYFGSKLTVGDRVVGTVCFVDEDPREPFSHHERAFFDILARWLAEVLEHRQMKQAETIFENTQDALFVVDVTDEPTFTIQRVNPAYEQLTGLRSEDMHGRTPREIVGDEQGAEIETRYRDCIEQREPIEYEEQLDVGDTTKWWHTKLAPIMENGHVTQLIGATRDITDQKEREQRLHEKQQFIDSIFRSLPDPLYAFDTDGYPIRWNEQFEAVTGYSAGEIEDMYVTEFVPDDETDTIATNFRTILEPDRTVTVESAFETKDGTRIPFEFTGGPLEAADGTIRGVTGIGREITDRKEREQELQRYQRIVEDLNDVATVIDSAGTITYVSPSVQRVLGYEPEDLIGENGFRYQPPETSGAVADAIEHVLDNPEETQTVQTRFRRADGSWCWIESTLRNRLDDEMIDGILVSSRDITERGHRRQELQRYEALVETLPIGYVRTSFDDEFIDMNSTFVDMLDGDSAEEIRSHDVSEFYQDQTTRERLMETLRGTGEVAGEELKATTMGGDTIWIAITGRVVDAEDGPYIDALVQDITERKRHAEQLRALNDRSQMLMSAKTSERIAEIGVEAARKTLGLDASSIHLYDTERSSLVPVAATDTLYDLIGDPPVFTGDEGIAWRVYEEGEALALDDVRADPDVLNPETPMRSELHFPLGDHGILLAGSPTPNAFNEQDVTLGKVLAANITSALDQVTQTERLRAREAELTRQNDRLEEFTSIVSHDLRNPLNVADGRLELARGECDSEHLAHVDRALDRMEGLIEDLLTLAREGETVTDFESADITAIAEGCWANVETADATLVVDGDRTIYADESRLKQVFENLIRNAVEHGGDDVSVTIGELDDGFYVADDGPGIPEDDRDDVFDPGYSASDEGTGFGLNIVKQVIEAHDWNIRVTESESGGARFEITDVEVAHE